MKRTAAVLAAAMIILVAGIGWTSGSGAAHDHGTPPASPSVNPVSNTGTGAVYLTITNDGNAPDRLLSASTDAARTVEMHDQAINDDVMSMTPLPDGVEIPAGDSIVFKPQGMHLMLVNLTRDLRPGDTYDLNLTFEHAGEVTVTVTVGTEAPSDLAAVTAGDLAIEWAWSLPAPMLTSGLADDPGTPGATPAHSH